MDFSCPHCGAFLKPLPEWAGKSGTCKSCNGRIVIPELHAATAAHGDPALTFPTHPSSAGARPNPRLDVNRPQIVTPIIERPNLNSATADGNSSKNGQPAPESVRKRELKWLIAAAANGDDAAAKRLVAPFVAPEEKLLMHGISAKFGLFPTYDFFFLTDRRVGDLEITPLTGNLNVEVAYLHKIDAFVVSQPAFPILLRLFMLSMYLMFPGIFLQILATIIFGVLQLPFPFFVMLAPVVVAGMGFLVYRAINPAIKRTFLRFKKSGLWLKLQGNPVGILIFADRNKFELLTLLTRKISDIKRPLG